MAKWLSTIRNRVSRAVAALTGESGTRSPAQWLIDWIRDYGESDSGVTVNSHTIMRYAPVWYGVNRISGHVGMLPLVMYRRTGEQSKRRAIEHPAYRLLKRRPNSAMSAAVFRETLQQHALLDGNGRAYIQRNNRGEPTGLIPLLPDRTKTVLVNGLKYHATTIATGGTQQFNAGDIMNIRVLPDEDVLHVPGLGYDGIVGYDLATFARNSVGLGLASEKQMNRHFKNNATPGLILEAPPGVFKDEDAAKSFLDNFNKYHRGLDKTDSVGMLREGITARPLGGGGRDNQWIEQRKFQRQEAALWLLLESILGDDASVSYNSLEQKHLAYLTNCLLRWLVKWEQECEEKLLTERQKMEDSHYVKFNVAALLRADTKTRYETYQIGIAARILNPNEARDLEELDSYDGGDEFENPNITPGAPGSTGSNNASAPPNGSAKPLIVARLTELLNIESKRVRSAAAKQKNFIEWLDRFYSSDNWERTLARAIDSIGGDATLGSVWCEQSRAALLDVAGSVSAESLKAAIEEAVSDWSDRIAALAEEIHDSLLTSQAELIS